MMVTDPVVNCPVCGIRTYRGLCIKCGFFTEGLPERVLKALKIPGDVPILVGVYTSTVLSLIVMGLSILATLTYAHDLKFVSMALWLLVVLVIGAWIILLSMALKLVLSVYQADHPAEQESQPTALPGPAEQKHGSE